MTFPLIILVIFLMILRQEMSISRPLDIRCHGGHNLFITLFKKSSQLNFLKSVMTLRFSYWQTLKILSMLTNFQLLRLSLNLICAIRVIPLMSASNITISEMEWWSGDTKIPIQLKQMYTGYNPETNQVWMIGGKDEDYKKLNSIYIMDLETNNITLSPSVLSTAMSCQTQAYTQIGSFMYFLDTSWTDESLQKLDMSTYTTSITAISQFPYSTVEYSVGCLASYDDKIYMAGVSRTCCRRTVVYSLKSGNINTNFIKISEFF